MRRLLVAAVLAAGLIALCSVPARGQETGGAAAPPGISLIPEPQGIELTGGGFTADTAAEIGFTGGAATAAAFLSDAIWNTTAFRLSVRGEEGAACLLWVSRGAVRPDDLERAREALEKAGDSREAYGLVIGEGGVSAAANEPAGLLCAAATLAQLLRSEGGKPFWPACVISDWPDLSLRVVHLDLKHHMEKPEYLEALPPRLASFKVNGLMVELEDKFLYRRRPEIAAPVGLSAEDLQAFVDRCRMYNIELIPLVQGLGHASYILKRPEYADLREQADAFGDFCPLAEGTYEVLFDLYGEVAAATEGTKYFHIGGDEARHVGICPRCTEALKTVTRYQLYETWMKRVTAEIAELGRIPMVWDDMLMRGAGDDLSGLPKELFYVRWSYSPNAAVRNAERLERYGKSGLRVVAAASTQTDNPYVPVYMSEHFPNIEGWARSVAANGLEGLITTAWEDSGPHVELFWPGYAATGEVGWNSKSNLDRDYMRKFARVFHGDDSGEIASAYALLGASSVDAYGLLATRGPYNIDQMLELPPLVPAAAPDRWRDRHAERIETADRLAGELGGTARILSDAIIGGRRSNNQALEVLLASNRMMLARVGVFRALANCERAIEESYAAFAAGGKDEAAELLAGAAAEIYGSLEQAETALASLESVWTRTRYPQDLALFETPERPYLHDYDNYRHLAARTRDLSFLVLPERRIGAREMADRLMSASKGLPEVSLWPFAADGPQAVDGDNKGILLP